MTEASDRTEELLKGILLALALKEEKRENAVKILRAGGLKQTEINSLIGVSDVARRVRKHRQNRRSP